MFKHRLTRKRKLSRKQSRSLIMMMTLYGDNQLNTSRRLPLASEDEVVTLFESEGYPFDELVDECRDPDATIPMVENMLQVGTMLLVSDEETEQVITSNYEAAFDIAISHLERAVSDGSVAEIESAIVRGIGSIEAFIGYLTEQWNDANPGKELHDSKKSKVSFEDKIDTWLPVITGSKLNKGTKHWNDFKRLRDVRDNLTVHPKKHSHTVKYAKLAELINAFRTGIVGILVDLHLLSHHWIPAAVVRAYHVSEVDVVSIDTKEAS